MATMNSMLTGSIQNLAAIAAPTSAMAEAIDLINEAARQGWASPLESLTERPSVTTVGRLSEREIQLCSDRAAQPLFEALLNLIVEKLIADGDNTSFDVVIATMRKWQGISAHLPLDKDIKKSLSMGFKALGNNPKAMRWIYAICKKG